MSTPFSKGRLLAKAPYVLKMPPPRDSNAGTFALLAGTATILAGAAVAVRL
jgi:hypothetical protein